MKTSKKIPFKTKNAKIINFYTGNILKDSRTVDLGISEISINRSKRQVLKYVKMKTSKKIPLKTKNAKNINFYTGNIFRRFENLNIQFGKLSKYEC